MGGGGVLVEVAQVCDDLLVRYRHSEVITVWTSSRNRKTGHVWDTTHPGLLAQLQEATEPGSAGSNAQSAATASLAPLVLTPLSLLIEIEQQAKEWARTAGAVSRETLAGVIRGVTGALAAGDPARLETWLSDLSDWRSSALVTLGWSQEFRVNACCPVDGCGRRGRIVVNVLKVTARCTACRTAWQPAELPRLADQLYDNSSVRATAIPLDVMSELHEGNSRVEESRE